MGSKQGSARKVILQQFCWGGVKVSFIKAAGNGAGHCDRVSY